MVRRGLVVVGLLGWVGCSAAMKEDAGVGDAGPPDADAGATSDAGSVTAVALTACWPFVFTAAVKVGGQPFELILDTASTTTAVGGTGCTSCGAVLYQPGATAEDEHMDASAMYGALAPSGWSGKIYEDEVSAGTPAVSARVKVVSIDQQAQFLVGTCGPGAAVPQGVLGAAPALTATAGTNGLLDALVADAGLPDLFAVELCSATGTMWLGGYEASHVTAAPIFTPMAPPGFDAYVYTVHVASIGVLGTVVPVPMGGYTATMLDTGSSISSLPSAELAALAAPIESSAAFEQVFGAAAHGFFSSWTNCAQLTQTKAELDALLPPLTLTFGEATPITVQATATEAYLMTPGGGRWCPAITTREPSPSYQEIAAIFGAPILRSNVVIFDRANKRIGFAPHAACP